MSGLTGVAGGAEEACGRDRAGRGGAGDFAGILDEPAIDGDAKTLGFKKSGAGSSLSAEEVGAVKVKAGAAGCDNEDCETKAR